MGAWDYGPFDNDGALDRVAELRSGGPEDMVDRLTAAMTMITDAEDYIENPEAQEAVAAAVLVAARLGAPLAEGPAHDLLASHPFAADPELIALAHRTLDRVTTPGDNEWYDLWAEAEAMDKVEELLKPYRETLAAGGAAPPA